jgi:hypothetical protein
LEKYNLSLSKWDTLPFGSARYQHSYDASGRLLETISIFYINIAGPDQNPVYVWNPTERKVFSQHQTFTENRPLNIRILKLYPNPLGVGQSFHLDSQQGRITISDLQGRALLSKSISESEDVSSTGLKPGIYQVLLEEADGGRSWQRLIIQ